MYLKHLSLTNYRNYTRLEIDLQARIVVVQGQNAQGKTNLLESIYFLATTKSPLTSTERQLIHWLADRDVIPYARVSGLYARTGQEHTLEITLVKERLEGDAAISLMGADPRGPVPADESNLKRRVCLDGVPRRALDVLGQINVVLFLPEDINLVAGPPRERRHYLDVTLCQVDPLYARSLSRYNRVLTQRNALLRRLRERQAHGNELGYWDEQLLNAGAYVLGRRLWAIRVLQHEVREIHPCLTGTQEELGLSYQSTLAEYVPEAVWQETQQTAQSMTEPVQTAEALRGPFQHALDVARQEEVARAVTLVGPHRDDVRFLISGPEISALGGGQVDATIYGSRGQQRTVALSLKLAEMNLMHGQTGEMPILLLDDVLSELDRPRSEFLLTTVARAEQVFVTTTSLAHYPRTFLDQALLWQIDGGQIHDLGLGSADLPERSESGL
jgi:DNA replication and repair protein RecF